MTILIVILALASCAGLRPEADSAVEPAPEPEPVPAGPVMVWKIAGETIGSPDGTVDKTVEYEYDAGGELVSVLEIDGRGNIITSTQWIIENGLSIRQEISDRYELVSTTDYEYNSVGQVVRETKKNADGENLSIVTFEYDGPEVHRSVAADGSGTPHLSAEYVYSNGTLKEVKYMLPSGAVEAVFERIIESGRVVEERTVLPDGRIESGRRFTYDGNRVSEEEHFTGSTATKWVRYEYDNEGNIVRETWSNRAGRDYEVVETRWILIEEKE